jgi:hypothetical protein
LCHRCPTLLGVDRRKVFRYQQPGLPYSLGSLVEEGPPDFRDRVGIPRKLLIEKLNVRGILVIEERLAHGSTVGAYDHLFG